MKAVLQKRIVEKLNDLIELGVAPGFQLGLGFRDKTLGFFSAGLRDVKKKRSLLVDTYMDIASLTKVVSTQSLLMNAYQEKLITDLELPLKTWFPALSSDLKNRTLTDLLHHRSGLLPVFEETEEIAGGREEKKRFFLRRIDETYETSRYGHEVYSDVGFMLLGMLLEVVYGDRLRNIFSKLFPPESGLRYGPLHFNWDGWNWLFHAPTVAKSMSLNESPEWLHGEVQDPRAAWLEGDAGHSGVFANVIGIENWAKEIYLSYHGKALRWSDKTLRTFISLENKQTRFVGGFDTPSHSETQISQAGFHATSQCVGHLGYTGCSFWMDMEKGYRMTLLSHRHQQGGRPEKLSNFRPGFHDWLYEEVFFRLEI